MNYNIITPLRELLERTLYLNEKRKKKSLLLNDMFVVSRMCASLGMGTYVLCAP